MMVAPWRWRRNGTKRHLRTSSTANKPNSPAFHLLHSRVRTRIQITNKSLYFLTSPKTEYTFVSGTMGKRAALSVPLPPSLPSSERSAAWAIAVGGEKQWKRRRNGNGRRRGGTRFVLGLRQCSGRKGSTHRAEDPSVLSGVSSPPSNESVGGGVAGE